MIGNPGCHSWRDPQGLVNPRKIIVHEVYRNRRRMVLDFLGEGICKAGQCCNFHALTG